MLKDLYAIIYEKISNYIKPEIDKEDTQFIDQLESNEGKGYFLYFWLLVTQVLSYILYSLGSVAALIGLIVVLFGVISACIWIFSRLFSFQRDLAKFNMKTPSARP